ncbi:MAG TPA: homoserine kinase, partial [Bacillales bacterium]|nr:homoserine kinase [Bacillales bacterium]
MSRKWISVQVPGSTSNLGAGFDSIGLAVDRYLELEVCESEDWHFEFKSPGLDGLPVDKRNLIYETAAFVASEAGASLPGCRVEVKSELPLARGLGSSAATIVAGIELADRLLELGLTKNEKFQLACMRENHCDNLAASVYGGLVVTSKHNGENRSLTAGIPAIEMVVIVPDHELKTTEARNILPKTMAFETAVAGSGVANMMVTAILQKNWDLAGELMTEDVFHQPYRAALVPNLAVAIKEARKAGAYGAALSGAGPTLIAFTPDGSGNRVATQLGKHFPDDNVMVVRPDSSGVTSQVKLPL